MIEIKTLVIVPAFNEEESIKKVVKEIKENNNNIDVVVVMMAQKIIHLLKLRHQGLLF